MVLSAILLLVATIPSAPHELAQGYEPLRAAFHVHSRFSNGHHDITDLARLSRERRIDVLGLSDSFLTRTRYGVPPFRRVLSISTNRAGVVDYGIDAFLNGAAAAEQAYPGVIVLPGVEVAPAYRWEGSVFDEIRLLDFDRHLIVYGLDRDALRDLPVIENERWSNVPRDWWRAAGPLAAWALAIGTFRLRPRKRLAMSVLFLIIASVWTWDAYPFGRFTDPYGDGHDRQAYQRVVDYVSTHEGVAYWSYPEARAPDMKIAVARMITRGPLDDLAPIDGYRGFEGLYGDKISATAPGGLWDQLLLDYLHGRRRVWPSVITGIDFHGFVGRTRWYDLDGGVTVLWSKSRNRAGVLDALRSGRGYATLQAEKAREITLRNFALSAGDKSALSGETLQTGGDAVVLSGILEAVPAAPNPSMIKVDIVRDGSLVDAVESALPLTITRTDALPDGKHFYRIHARYGETEILSNPIFANVNKQAGEPDRP